MARASSAAGRSRRTAHVEHEDDVAGAIHAARSCGRQADGGRSSLNLSFEVRALAVPRTRADLSIARAPSRVTASRKPSSTIGEAAARAAASAAPEGARGARRFSLSGGQRALPEGDLVDASPAEMRVHSRHDHRGAVLRLERESALDS